MIGALIGIIFTLIILGVLWWAVQTLMALIPIAEPFRTIIYVMCVIIMVLIVLYVISMLLGMAGIHVGGFGHLSAIALPLIA
jgi:hypothetical protein